MPTSEQDIDTALLETIRSGSQSENWRCLNRMVNVIWDIKKILVSELLQNSCCLKRTGKWKSDVPCGITHLVSSQNFPKNYYFLPPNTHMYIQGVRNVSFSENFAKKLNHSSGSCCQQNQYKLVSSYLLFVKFRRER